MRRYVPAYALAVVLSVGSLTVGDAAQAQRPRVYMVRQGDALSLIAERFGLSVEQIREWNELEGDRILVGQELSLRRPSRAERRRRAAEARARARAAQRAAAAAEAEAQAAEAAAEEAPEREPERAPEPEPAPVEEPYDGPTYTVQRGDTLSEIATRLGVSVPDLLEMNPRVRPDRIRAGQELRIRDPRPAIDYTVRRGETLARIATRHEVTVRELRRWNPRVRRHGLQAGRVIRIYSHVPVSRSESVGRPNAGSLVNPEALGRHPSYVIREPSRAFGTLETVLWIQQGFDAVRAAFPGGPRVRIHDLSDRDGGRLRDHRSHQSGRDADIAFFRRACGQNECGFAVTSARQLDVRRQWTLLEHWLRNGRVEAVFIDYSLQEALYNEARRRGATRRELARWFQYPRGRGHAFGIVRHFEGHQDHLHVRFVCPDTDGECRPGWRFARAH